MYEEISARFLETMPKNVTVVYMENDEAENEPYVFQRKENLWVDVAHCIEFDSDGLSSFINEYIADLDAREYIPNVLFGDENGKSWDKSEVNWQLGHREMM